MRELTEQDVRVINQAILALLGNNHCLITDRPELGFQAETSWTTNFTQEINALEALIIKCGAHTATGQAYMHSTVIPVKGSCSCL